MRFNDIIEDLQQLIDNTENGIYDYDYEASLKGEIYYIKIIVKNATIWEMSYFLKELENFRVIHRLLDFQILIEKDKPKIK